ncbi:MAG TPA: alpha/beta hydrolase fold domain-containing protein, partial [Bryobacteraceae bacterium]
MRPFTFIFLLGAACLAQSPVAPPKLEGAVPHQYKQTSTRPLYLYSLAPAQSGSARPAIVFFFGGGWKGGSTDQFDDQARHLTDRGMVSILVDYRVEARDRSTPFDSVHDARSAMRWVRTHAAELHIDPSRIVASGGSAGGHLAGATAILDGVDDPADDLRVSPAPAALILFNPVLDTTETGYGAAMIGTHAIDLSLT